MDADTIEAATKAFMDRLRQSPRLKTSGKVDRSAFPIHVSHRLAWSPGSPMTREAAVDSAVKAGAAAANDTETLGGARWPGKDLSARATITLHADGPEPYLEWALEVQPVVTEPVTP